MKNKKSFLGFIALLSVGCSVIAMQSHEQNREAVEQAVYTVTVEPCQQALLEAIKKSEARALQEVVKEHGGDLVGANYGKAKGILNVVASEACWGERRNPKLCGLILKNPNNITGAFAAIIGNTNQLITWMDYNYENTFMDSFHEK